MVTNGTGGTRSDSRLFWAVGLRSVAMLMEGLSSPSRDVHQRGSRTGNDAWKPVWRQDNIWDLIDCVLVLAKSVSVTFRYIISYLTNEICYFIQTHFTLVNPYSPRIIDTKYWNYNFFLCSIPAFRINQERQYSDTKLNLFQYLALGFRLCKLPTTFAALWSLRER